MTHLTVANEVNDDITAELLTILGSDAEGVSNIVHGVGIDVEDGSADSSGNLGAVSAGTGTIRGRCETDLVVDDNVDGATDRVVVEPFHLEALINDTLASNSSITMHNNRHHGLAVLCFATEEVLFSTATTLDARVDSLEMRWVGHQSQLDLVARITVSASESRAKMVLHITSVGIDSLIALVRLDALELGHDNFHRFAHDIGESIKSTAMGHANDESARTFLHCRVDAEFESGNERFAALKTEPLHRVEFAGHESTPLVSVVKASVHVDALTLGWLPELDRLELLADPVADFALLDMHELDANFAAIGLAVGTDEVTQLPPLFALGDSAVVGHADRELTVHISISEAVMRRVEHVEELLVGETELLGETGAIGVDLFQVKRIDV